MSASSCALTFAPAATDRHYGSLGKVAALDALDEAVDFRLLNVSSARNVLNRDPAALAPAPPRNVADLNFLEPAVVAPQPAVARVLNVAHALHTIAALQSGEGQRIAA